MPDFLFDGPNKLIIEPAGVGDTTFDVARDIYSAWKRWVQTGFGAQYVAAFEVEGGSPIGSTGLFTGSTVLMVNGWRIQPADHDHQLFLIGNLYSSEGVVSVSAPNANTNVFVSAAVAAQGVSSGSGLSPEQDTRLTRALDILEADEEYTATQATKRHKDTKAVLVQKDATSGPMTPVALTEPS